MYHRLTRLRSNFEQKQKIILEFTSSLKLGLAAQIDCVAKS